METLEQGIRRIALDMRNAMGERYPEEDFIELVTSAMSHTSPAPKNAEEADALAREAIQYMEDYRKGHAKSIQY
ncbi:hypothetical protein [Effusibacillus lacus]|uniref:Uncharacterized protein n=1 Tax=Effusibacillus lacus TaxID=1348429 RepID=A0A292YJ07_9BACL|nr:hypothetical protein [Effusibacillus lacus]TCS74602.1 hypothetical protein EDD64_11250 [Effusibacillus lacus]GAX88475.1 hypothetical protein EFBL_0084 [Effusibacillus lacus]